jgi:hypothetical protein
MAMAAKEPKAEVHLVGTIRGLRIYDVFYRFNGEGSRDWKSILVRTGPDNYREIYHNQPNEGVANPSFLIKIGEETALGVKDNEYRLDVMEAYWCFNASGPEQLDFEPVWEAAGKVIPKGYSIIELLNRRTTLPNLTVSIDVLGPLPSQCCDFRGTFRGTVNVKFRIEQCRIRVTDADFQPDAGR